MSIFRKGKVFPWMNRIPSDETKDKLRKATKKLWSDPIKRKKMLDRCRWNNMLADKGQIELLTKWNRLGFNFKPNYQLKTEMDLFYIDGYDKEKNIVIEYDSKYHKKTLQKQKDLIRQNKIINILNPRKFWRYDAVNKEFKNVIEGRS
jgi:very-short-patch-repair endonuclease